MKTAVLSLVALTCSCANAFTVSTASLRTQARGRTSPAVSRTSLQMGWSLKEADFIPSEEWLGEYMSKQGLRYRMDKTEKEVEEEGDYTLLQKLFGQTSNNRERMKLKQEVLDKANIPTNPDLYKSWTEKYGYGRFFPVYVDKSGSIDDDSPAPIATAKKAAAGAKSLFNKKVAPKAAEAKAEAKSLFNKKVAPKAAEAKSEAKSLFNKKVAPKAAGAKAAVAKKVAPQAAKAKAAVKEVAKKAAPKAAAAKKAVAKPVGNIANLPKAL